MRVLHAKIPLFGDCSLSGWWAERGHPPLRGRLIVETDEAAVSSVVNDVERLMKLSKKSPHLVSPNLVVQVLPFKERADLYPVKWSLSRAA